MFSDAWDKVDSHTGIERTLHFQDFKDAFNFMTEVAIISEKVNHHPEWHQKDNVLKIVLYTWSINDLSEKDIMLAYEIDQLANRYFKQHMDD